MLLCEIVVTSRPRGEPAPGEAEPERCPGLLEESPARDVRGETRPVYRLC